MHELRDVMIHHALTIAHAQSTVSSIWPPARPIPLQVGGLAAVKPTAISVGITEADVVTRVAHHAKTNAFQLGQLFGSNRYCPATLPHACCTTRRTTECGGLTEAMQPQCAVWHRWECWKIAHGTLVVPWTESSNRRLVVQARDQGQAQLGSQSPNLGDGGGNYL